MAPKPPRKRQRVERPDSGAPSVTNASAEAKVPQLPLEIQYQILRNVLIFTDALEIKTEAKLCQ